MATTGSTTEVLTTVLAARWQAAAQKFIALAAAIPNDQYEAELVQGTRTCSALLRHVAYWNRYVADTLNGRPADDSGNELTTADCPDKAAALADLENTSSQIAAAINGDVSDQSMPTFFMGLEHLSEHYGQLAVYARLLGITPPASQS